MKTDTLKIHLDILDEDRTKILKVLIPLVNKFCLGGGTALAVQLEHRQSCDFDFFYKKEIAENFLNKVSESLQIKEVLTNDSDELTIITDRDIKCTFLYYPFPQIFSENIEFNGLQMFTLKAIAIQKAYTIGRRGAYRDYFDLYTILEGGYIDIKEILAGAYVTYGSLFEPKLFFKQLVYMDDITDYDIIPLADHPIPSVDTVKDYFHELVEKAIR